MNDVFQCPVCKQNTYVEEYKKTGTMTEKFRYRCTSCGFEESGYSENCPDCKSLLTPDEEIDGAGGGSGDYFTITLNCACGYKRKVSRYWSSQHCV